MVKKTQAAAAAATTPAAQPKIRVLGAVPACSMDHVQYREQVLAAVKVNIEANSGVEVVFTVDESPDNRVETENSWNSVVDKFNALTERVLAEKFDYLWLVEADVIIPPNALEHLLSCKVDMAAAVVPYHFQNYLPFPIFKDMACTGYFLPGKNGKPSFDIVNLYINDIKDKLLVGSPEHMIFNGTGCILISRRIFEAGLRWRWDNKVCGFDVYFWQDVQRAGFTAVTDGFVICQHLGK